MIFSPLFRWNTRHYETKFWTSFLIPLQKKSFLIMWYVFKNLGFPPIGEVCNSRRTFYSSWEFLHKYRRSWYHRKSFFHTKLFNELGSSCSFWMIFHTFRFFFHSIIASSTQIDCGILWTLCFLFFPWKGIFHNIMFSFFVDNFKVVT